LVNKINHTLNYEKIKQRYRKTLKPELISKESSIDVYDSAKTSKFSNSINEGKRYLITPKHKDKSNKVGSSRGQYYLNEKVKVNTSVTYDDSTKPATSNMPSDKTIKSMSKFKV
jgi:hypothetical protein